MTALEKTDPPVQLAENLWVIDGDWQETSFRRRMTIVRLRDGSLWLHSPIALVDSDRAWLDSLGIVRWVVAPNAYHCSDVAWYVDRYPDCFAVGSDPALPAIHRQVGRNLLAAAQTAREHWNGQIDCRIVEGTRFLGESAFFHSESRTLILTDIAFCMEDHRFKSKIEKWLMQKNRVGGGRFGPSWLAENFFFKDREAVSRSLAAIARWDFDRIIVNHGRVVQTNGSTVFRIAFRHYLSGSVQSEN